VFSGDGQHGNPERDTLRMLWDARGDTDYAVHLTYPIDKIDSARQVAWNKERSKELKKRKLNDKKKVRPVWSSSEHSIAAFLDSTPSFAAKVLIVDENKPHIIDLGEALFDVWPSLASCEASKGYPRSNRVG